jgi:membrane-associated phospholipid phosphatase
MTVVGARSHLERGVRRLAARRPLWSSFVVAVAPPLLLGVVLAISFGALAEEVLDEEAVVTIDREVAQTLHEQATPAATELWLLVSNVGGLVGLGLLALAAAVVLQRSSRLAAAFVACVYVGALALVGGLKLGFGRARPTFVEPLAEETTFSFPSGHATVSLALLGALCFLLARSTSRRGTRIAIVAVAAGVVLAIGFSRLYLGVHYLSDVLAGWLAGGTALALCIAVLLTLEHRAQRPVQRADVGHAASPRRNHHRLGDGKGTIGSRDFTDRPAARRSGE